MSNSPMHGAKRLRSKNLANVDRQSYLDNSIEFGLDGDLDQFLQSIDRQLEPYLKRAVEMVPNIDHVKEGVVYQVRTGGKRLRAALCAASCELFCGTSLRALSFAAAIEH